MNSDVDKLTKLIAIISRNLSKALAGIASELDNPLSQAQNSNFVSLTASKSNFVSLDLGVFVLFEHQNGNRYGAIITKIDGDTLEVSNDVLGKTWTISRLQVFYSRLNDHE